MVILKLTVNVIKVNFLICEGIDANITKMLKDAFRMKLNTLSVFDGVFINHICCVVLVLQYSKIEVYSHRGVGC